MAGILKTGEVALTAESDSHVFETVEELLSPPEPMKVIDLRRKDPYVYVKIEADSAFVFAMVDDLVSAGLVSELVEYVKTHRIPRILDPPKWVMWTLGLLSGWLAADTTRGLGLWHILPLLVFLAISIIQIRFVLRSMPTARIVFRRETGTPIHSTGEDRSGIWLRYA